MVKLIPTIKILPETQMIGKQVTMSFTENKTEALWQDFIPKRKDILNTTSSELYSVEIYPSEFFNAFNPSTLFEKWAAVQVSDIEQIPNGMGSLTIPSELYAMFLYKGKASEVSKTYEYILKEWLPNSGYQLDDRPHLGIMGKAYKDEDPDSEEELWIPIKK